MKFELVYGAYICPEERPWFGTIWKAIAKAFRSGYSFLLFNDTIYFVISENEAHETPLHREDIFCNLR